MVAHEDGGLLIRDGRIAACGDFREVRRVDREARVTDRRDGFLLPGLIDAHTHFPQLRVLGELGEGLLGWLGRFALPEEARMANTRYARETARRFVRAMLAHGTTTAMVFGAHFAPATAALFEVAGESGMRIVSGLVLSDRGLRPELHQTPEAAYRESRKSIRRFHGRGRLLYAVTPRFAVSTTEAMLEVCDSLRKEHPGVRVQTHINENAAEIDEVRRLFPWAADYLAVYERFHLDGAGSVMAHNIHASASEIERMAGSGTAVAHCPCSNAALGSGSFPLRRHLARGVKVALGSDVGAGTGPGILKEGLQAYLVQRLMRNGVTLSAPHLLYLATRAGAEALQMTGLAGDFGVGKSADLLYLRAPRDSPLAAVLDRCESMERALAALFTLGDAACVAEVRIEGEVVHRVEAA